MAHISVCAPLSHPRHHRQNRLFAVQRLNLRFLIHTQHNRAIGWRQIQPHDVLNFVDKQRVAGQFECLATMGLQAKSIPDAPDRRVR